MKLNLRDMGFCPCTVTLSRFTSQFKLQLVLIQVWTSSGISFNGLFKMLDCVFSRSATLDPRWSKWWPTIIKDSKTKMHCGKSFKKKHWQCSAIGGSHLLGSWSLFFTSRFSKFSLVSLVLDSQAPIVGTPRLPRSRMDDTVLRCHQQRWHLKPHLRLVFSSLEILKLREKRTKTLITS